MKKVRDELSRLEIRNFQEEPTCSHLTTLILVPTFTGQVRSPGNRLGDGHLCVGGFLGRKGSRLGREEKWV